jgi:WD40 repeat protein
VWETATGKQAGVLNGHNDAVYAVGIAPDGKRAASAGAEHSIRLWNLPRDVEAVKSE